MAKLTELEEPLRWEWRTIKHGRNCMQIAEAIPLKDKMHALIKFLSKMTPNFIIAELDYRSKILKYE